MDNERTTPDSAPNDDTHIAPARPPSGPNSPEISGYEGGSLQSAKNGGPASRKSSASQQTEIVRKGKPSTVRPNIPFGEKRWQMFAKELGLIGMRKESVRDYVATMIEKASDRALLRLVREDKEDSGDNRQI